MEVLKAKRKTGPKPKSEQQKIFNDLLKDGNKRFRPRSSVNDDMRYMHRLLKAFYRIIKKSVK